MIGPFSRRYVDDKKKSTMCNIGHGLKTLPVNRPKFIHNANINYDNGQFDVLPPHGPC